MAAGRFLTAPYIQRRPSRRGTLLIRSDPQRRARTAIRATKLVENILAECATPHSVGEVVQALRGDHRPREIESAIDELVQQDLLLRRESLSLLYPSVELEITNHCNAKCVMCPRQSLRPLGSMNADTFARVLDFISSYPCEGVLLQGIGEPTLHRDLTAHVADLREVLGPSRPIVLVTNGFTLSGTRLGQLREAGLSYVKWSLHTVDHHTHAEIMGIDRYERTIRNLEDCARDHSEIIYVVSVIMDVNREHVRDLRSFIASLGIAPSRLRLIPVFSRGGLLNLDQVARHSSRHEAVGRCLYVKKAVFIGWNGDLMPCSNDFPGRHVLGSVLSDSPEEILTKWRTDLIAQPVDFPMCQKCDHHSRGTLPTAWFEEVNEMPLVAREVVDGRPVLTV